MGYHIVSDAVRSRQPAGAAAIAEEDWMSAFGSQGEDATDALRHPLGSRAEGPGGFLAELVSGFGSLFEGLDLLRRERGLWGLALAPVGFSLLALVVASALIYTNAAMLFDFIAGLIPLIEVDRWYEWIWLGPLKLVFWLLGYVLFIVVAGLGLVLALLVSNVAAAPFLDTLSFRVERIAAGRVLASDETGFAAVLRDAGRSIKGEAQRLGFFLAIWLPLVALGFALPGLHVITGPLSVLLTILFLPLDFGGYTLDRRRIPFRARRAWLGSHLPRMLGFGGAAFVACLVPGVNLVMIPVLVVAGTLLVLRIPPASALDPVGDRAGVPRT